MNLEYNPDRYLTMKKPTLSRRELLQLSALTLGTLSLSPFQPPLDDYDIASIHLARIVLDQQVAIYKEPAFHSGIYRWTRQDELLNIYYQLNSFSGPANNPLWYRVWGGYIHSANIQVVFVRYNDVLKRVPSGGQLAEVSVPYSQAYTYTRRDGWVPKYRLYYETTHWVTDLLTGPDGSAWYQLTSELTDYLVYYVPAIHLRPIPDEEIAPISPDVAFEEKRIEVLLEDQLLIAFERDQPIYRARISSGLAGRVVPEGTQTPTGEFHISSKSPSKHMGNVQASGAPDSYILPGVPWTSFFIPETGVAFHGTFWHSNFGVRMSHGCINMSNQDAKWLFRWVLPAFKLPALDRQDWDARGFGTQVLIT